MLTLLVFLQIENIKMGNFLFLSCTLSNALEDSYLKKPLQYILISVSIGRWKVFARGLIAFW